MGTLLLRQQTGVEGLSASADGKTLYMLLQAAANQEGVSSLPKRHPCQVPQGSKEGNELYFEGLEFLIHLTSLQSRIESES